MLEVVVRFLLISDVVVREDGVSVQWLFHNLTVFVFSQQVTLVAAAGQQLEDQDDGKSGDDEDNVLQDVEPEQCVEIGHVHFIGFALPFVVYAHIENGEAEDQSFAHPLTDRPRREALVPAWLQEDAMAEDVVDDRVDADSEGATRQVGFESQIE